MIACNAFVWNAATGMQDLGTLGGASSEAHAISDGGWIVGNSEDINGEVRAFVHHDPSMIELDKVVNPIPQWTFFYAHGINDSGEIVVDGSSPSEPWLHALLLTPIPEPSALRVISCTVIAIVAEASARCAFGSRPAQRRRGEKF
jgi:probable HAF family extracellular repeat protein